MLWSLYPARAEILASSETHAAEASKHAASPKTSLNMTGGLEGHEGPRKEAYCRRLGEEGARVTGAEEAQEV